MVLPVSETISSDDIQTEHGGVDPIALSEYRGIGGGTRSGPMAFSDFHGTTGNLFCGGVHVWEWRNGSSDPTGVRSRTHTFGGKIVDLGSENRTLFLAVVVTYPDGVAMPSITPLLRRLGSGFPDQGFTLVGQAGAPLTGAFGVGTTYNARTAVYIFQSPNDSNTSNLWGDGNDISITVNSNQDMYGLAWRFYSANANKIFLKDIQGDTDATTSTYDGSSITLNTNDNCFMLSASCLYAEWDGGATMMTGWNSEWGGGAAASIQDYESYYMSARDLYRPCNLQQTPSTPTHTVTLAHNTPGYPLIGHRSAHLVACFSGDNN